MVEGKSVSLNQDWARQSEGGGSETEYFDRRRMLTTYTLPGEREEGRRKCVTYFSYIGRLVNPRPIHGLWSPLRQYTRGGGWRWWEGIAGEWRSENEVVLGPSGE